jgi:DNA-directed RNA polymerase subunit RPC12/RpoP
MRIECECGKPLKVSDTLIGKRVRCPGCGSTLLVKAEPEAIAAGRPKRAATVADNTPPPRKRRPVADDDDSPPPPRKRRRDDDEDDRPRKSKKSKKSGGMPLMLILGAAAAFLLLVVLVAGSVGAYFLFFRKGPDTASGAPGSGPGSKNEPVAVKFHVPANVGDVFEFNVVDDQGLSMVTEQGPKGRLVDDKTAKIRAAGTGKVQAVDGAGHETRLELILSNFAMNKGQGDINLLPANTAVIRQQNGPMASYVRKDGAMLNLDALQALQEAFGKGGADDDKELEASFGTKEKKSVGDSWPINKSAMVNGINAGAKGVLVLREQDVTGTVKFSGVTTEGGVRCLDFDIKATIAQTGVQPNVPGMQGVANVTITITGNFRVPADYSTPALRQTMTMNMKMDSNVQVPGGGAANVKLSLLMTKTATRKYQSSGKKRADLGPRPVDGMPRLEVALDRWADGGFFPPHPGLGSVCTSGGGLGLQNRRPLSASCSESSISATDENDLASSLALLAKKSPDLALVAERWEALPEAVRVGIVAMVKAAGYARITIP